MSALDDLKFFSDGGFVSFSTCSCRAHCSGHQSFDAIRWQGIQSCMKSLISKILQVVKKTSPHPAKQETHTKHSEIFEHLQNMQVVMKNEMFIKD